jgi:Chaperone of endosialidase
MANNPTTNKQLNRPDYNDQNWNVPLNSDFTIIDQCLGSTLVPSQASTNLYTLSSTDIQNMRVNLGGTLTATGTATIPATYGGFWIVSNTTTGGYDINFKVLTGANNVVIKNGYTTIVFSDGTNCYEAVSQKLNITGGTIAGNLAVTGTVNVGSGKITYDPSAGTPQFYVTGTIYATSNITAFSDERLKHNVETISDALSLVNQMRGVRFEDENGNKYVGLIAQEVQKAVPEAVVTHAESGYLAVAYQNLVGVLVNAVKELSDRIEILEKRI